MEEDGNGGAGLVCGPLGLVLGRKRGGRVHTLEEVVKRYWSELATFGGLGGRWRR